MNPSIGWPQFLLIVVILVFALLDAHADFALTQSRPSASVGGSTWNIARRAANCPLPTL